jgi:hypothetical protein
MTEKDFQKQCNDTLRYHNLLFRHDEGGRLHKIRRKGWPDLVIYGPNGKTVFIELKVGNGKLKPEQQQYIDKLKELEYSCYVCYTKDEFDYVMYKEWKLYPPKG